MILSPKLSARSCWPQRRCPYPPRLAAACKIGKPGRPTLDALLSRRGRHLACAEQQQQPGSKAGHSADPDLAGPPTAGGGTGPGMETPPLPHPAAHGLHLPPGRRLEGQSVLLLVAVLWGSYTPAVRCAAWAGCQQMPNTPVTHWATLPQFRFAMQAALHPARPAQPSGGGSRSWSYATAAAAPALPALGRRDVAGRRGSTAGHA